MFEGLDLCTLAFASQVVMFFFVVNAQRKLTRTTRSLLSNGIGFGRCHHCGALVVSPTKDTCPHCYRELDPTTKLVSAGAYVIREEDAIALYDVDHVRRD